MPFGLKNGSYEFYHQMDEVYASVHLNCLIYIDNVLIFFSKIMEEHKQYLKQF